MRCDLQYRDDVPVIEVRVLSGDRLVALDYCADQAQVAEVKARWAHRADVTFLVDDFSATYSDQSARRNEIPQHREVPIAVAALSGSGWE